MERRKMTDPDFWAKEKETVRTLGDHATILRDPTRIAVIAAEIIEELRKQNVGESESALSRNLEIEVYWVLHNIHTTRHDLIRAASVLLSNIVHWDYGVESGFGTPKDYSQASCANCHFWRGIEQDDMRECQWTDPHIPFWTSLTKINAQTRADDGKDCRAWTPYHSEDDKS